MKMTYRTASVIMAILTMTGILQAQVTGYGLGDFYNSFLGSKYGKIISQGSEIKGSPFENETFTQGEVFTKSGPHYSGIPLRYNIYSDQMEFYKTEAGIFEIDHPERIDSLFIGSSKYIYVESVAGSNTRKGWFKVLTNLMPQLLLKMNVDFNPSEPPALYKEAVPANFKRMHDAFCLMSEKNVVVPFSGKKEFLGIIPAHQKDMEQFINKNKIRLNKRDDMITLMNFYYTLSKSEKP